MNASEPERPSKLQRKGSVLLRRWGVNLALFLAIGMVAVFAWYRSANPPLDGKPPLTALDPDAVRRIAIERPGQPGAVLERTDSGWRLVEPFKARADSLAVNSLLQLARAPVEATFTPAGGELARYSLDRPKLTVRLDNTAIHFGDAHPLKDNYYVRTDSTVRLIPGRYYAQASVKHEHFIDSRLIEPGRKPAMLKLPGFTLANKDGAWQRQPEIASLSSDRINEFVDAWRHARALQVEKYSGQPLRDHVTISFAEENQQPITIGVLARQPEFILVRTDEGLAYRFPTEIGQRLLTLSAEPAQ